MVFRRALKAKPKAPPIQMGKAMATEPLSSLPFSGDHAHFAAALRYVAKGEQSHAGNCSYAIYMLYYVQDLTQGLLKD